MFYHIIETVSSAVQASDKFQLSRKYYLLANKPQLLRKFCVYKNDYNVKY